MTMQHMPQVKTLENGAKYWEHEYDLFTAQVYVPEGKKLAEVVNFGFRAPYVLVFAEKKMSESEAAAFAEEKGFAAIAAGYSGSVVFATAKDGAWDAADAELFRELIANSKIGQYYKDGVLLSRNRFTGEWGECFIRGAIFRTLIFAYGQAADYVGAHLLQTLEGQYLWGPGEITPMAAVLEGMTKMPAVTRRDIPVVSVGNSEEVNAYLKANCDRLLVQDKEDVKAAYAFAGGYKRWCGVLENEPDMDAEGMVEEADVTYVKTSPDNLGDEKDMETHPIGYLAYYRKGLLDQGPVPLVLAFHGGGDSCYYITHVSGWWRVAQRNHFLLVAIENHLNTTATEVMELIENLKKKYPIDEKRIYGTGFSMGGCKSWDLYQEYPEAFAALAPMDATFEVGLNIYGKPAPKAINENVAVPVFYAGGEVTPLPELPFQAEKCWDRIRYVFRVNQVKMPYDVTYEEKASWPNPIWGIDGDRTEVYRDESRQANLTVQLFDSVDGVCRTALASISEQGHECREHTCEMAWQFMKQFSR